MNRNSAILLALLVILAAVGIFAWQLSEDSEPEVVGICERGDVELAGEFVVKDTGSVDRVVITDSHGKRVDVSRSGTQWEYFTEIYDDASEAWQKGETYRARQDAIELLLKTFYRVELKELIAENAKENIIRQILVSYKKVDIYKGDKLFKTWYVGIPTQDHYGTYMLLELPDCGKSRYPFVMTARNFHGTLWPRFFTEEKDWRYTGIWELDPNDIASVTITPGAEPEMGFTFKMDENQQFSLFDAANNPVPGFDTSLARNFFVAFKKVHFEKFDQNLEEHQRDSVLNDAPIHYTISTTTRDGKTTTLRTHRKKVPEGSTDMAGEPIEYDHDRLFGVNENREILMVQYWTFNALFRKITDFRPTL